MPLIEAEFSTAKCDVVNGRHKANRRDRGTRLHGFRFPQLLGQGYHGAPERANRIANDSFNSGPIPQ